MPATANSRVTLRLFGDDLDPAQITASLAAEPTRATRKGEVRVSKVGREIVSRTGSWLLSVEGGAPGDVSGQLLELFSRLTPDLTTWRRLTSGYKVDVFCGFFMDRGNDGFSLSPEAVAALSDRGLEIGFDVYEPNTEERPLHRHPVSSGSHPLVVDVEFIRSHSNCLRLQFTLRGNLEDVLIPAESDHGRKDRLWNNTCFEAFVMASGEEYFEFNLSPSQQWAAYRFDGYRSGMAIALLEEPWIGVSRQDGRIQLTTELELGSIPALAGKPWRVGLSAVLEEVQRGKSYWALAHPVGKPDFHHPDSFVLELPA